MKSSYLSRVIQGIARAKYSCNLFVRIQPLEVPLLTKKMFDAETHLVPGPAGSHAEHKQEYCLVSLCLLSGKKSNAILQLRSL